MVTLVETHVGHGDELKTKRLPGIEQKYIAEKLAAGVPKDRIIQDARQQVQDGKIQRKNITRGDLAYLTRKFNTDNKGDTDDMIATALKVAEWNKEGKNYGFLFKQIGKY